MKFSNTIKEKTLTHDRHLQTFFIGFKEGSDGRSLKIVK